MSVQSTARYAGPFAGNAVTTVFAFAFKVFATTDVVVLQTVTASGAVSNPVNGVDYTVQLNADQTANPGGTITFAVAPPATISPIYITSGIPKAQLSLFPNPGPWNPTTAENAWDKSMAIIQEVEQAALLFAPGDVASTHVLPSPKDRSGKLIGFDAVGALTTFIVQVGTSIVDLAASAGATLIGFIQPDTGAIPRTAAAVLRGTKRASDFGFDPAAPAGTNVVALTAALNTGKHVEIEDGAYNINAGFSVNTSGQNIVFQSRNTQLIASADFDIFTLNASFIEMRNGTLTGPNTGTTALTAAIKNANCTRGLVSNMQLEKCGYGYRAQGAASNWVMALRDNYIFTNGRAGIYGLGHGSKVSGGEISGSPYLILQALLQAGAALKIDRDNFSGLGDGITIDGVTLESAGTVAKAVTGAVNAAGLIRLTVVGHGYSTGDCVSAYNVGGVPNATGVWPAVAVDVDHLDLLTSTFAGAFTSGGSVRRGVGLYWGVGQAGPEANLDDVEDVPIIIQLGDAFKNDGVTPHGSFVTGGGIHTKSINNDGVVPGLPSALVMNNRMSDFVVVGNSNNGSTNITLVNSRGANLAGAVYKWGNPGFTREYELSGNQAHAATVYKAASRTGGVAHFGWHVPATAGGAPTEAISLNNSADATYCFLSRVNSLFLGNIQAAAQFQTTRIAPAYGPNVLINAALGNRFDVIATNGVAFNINDPTGGLDGQKITITVRNTSGGVLGAITFGAGAYKMLAFTAPTNGNNCSVTFELNGAGKWEQTTPQTLQVPN